MTHSNESVLFVRHSGDGFLGQAWSQEWLFNDGDSQQRIGVHYQDQPSFDSSDYTHGANRISRFNKAGVEPTVVVVGFSKLPKNEKYVSKTIPESQEIVVMDTDHNKIVEVADVTPGKRILEFDEKYREQSQYKIIKTLQVERWKSVHHDTHKPLWDWHGRQTLHDTRKRAAEKKRYIRAVYQGEAKPILPDSLRDREQELLAEKYLRNRLTDFRLEAPRGGRLENIDLLGSTMKEDEGEITKVVASVTSSTGGRRQERVQTINSYSDRTEAYFFDLEGARPSNLDEDITYVSLEEVFDWMNSKGKHRQHSLYTMLGVEDPI